MDTSLLSKALDRFRSNGREYFHELTELVRLPSVSFPGFDAQPVLQCARFVEGLLRKRQLTDIRILDAGSGYPSVFGQWLGAPGGPTILLYATMMSSPWAAKSYGPRLPSSPRSGTAGSTAGERPTTRVAS